MSSALAAPRALGAQVPRLTPPPPCRVTPSDTVMLNTVRASARTGLTSVAVLELQTQVLDARRAHLAPAITAELRSRIATIPTVAVESKGTVERVFSASGGRVDSLLSVLADKFAVIGEVTPQRDRIDVAVRVLQRGSDTPKWERVYAYPRVSVDQIVTGVATAVAQLAESRLPPAPAIAASTHDILIRGDYFLAGHDAVSADSARRTYERAAQLDRRSAIPAARAARARAAILERTERLESRFVGEQVLAGMSMADAALRRDSSLAEAWTARAILLRYRNPDTFAGSVQAHERAVKLTPNSPAAHEAYGETLMRLGRDAQAEQQLRRSLALEPNRASALRLLAELEFMRRRFGSSCALANAAIGADPYDATTYALRARVRMRQSEFRDAYADAEIAGRLSQAVWGNALQLLVTANATIVDDARLEAKRVATAKLRPGVKMSLEEGMYTSLTLETLGDRDRAFDALSRIEPTGAEFIASLRDPGFDQMRSDQRFRKLTTVREPKTARGEVTGNGPDTR
jgi:tetratricopeptide (TPR) repeat protein